MPYVKDVTGVQVPVAGLSVAAGWHKIVGTAPNGNLLTLEGLSLPPSPQAATVDECEASNCCPTCIPEKADPTLVANVQAVALAASQTATRQAAEAQIIALGATLTDQAIWDTNTSLVTQAEAVGGSYYNADEVR